VHGRTVLTLAGSADQLRESLLAGAAEAIERIDLRRHAGAHPHVGALDVCPVVFPDHTQADPASDLALSIADGLAALGLPVFLYGRLASAAPRRERHHFRAGGPERLAERMASGELHPDLGPPAPHPTAGAALVTARPPLGAFNVEISGIDLEAARAVAAELRESGGGMEGVRAIAIELGDGRMQISTNVHDPAATTLGRVATEVDRLARGRGGTADGAELVGLVPERALAGYPPEIPIAGADPIGRTIEARLRQLGRG